MLAVAYCYLVSVYATPALHGLQFAGNVGWRTTTSFIFHLDVLRLLKLFIYFSAFPPSLAFGPFSKCTKTCGPVIHFSRFHERFWHLAHFRNTQRHVARLYIFSFS